ncbi:MAG: tetratricopeptide repeat protein [Candidatus Latescibacteria bacterium]|nr:tetratricopeptide repeat protein [Candidatus Latescibacterota bacterium]
MRSPWLWIGIGVLMTGIMGCAKKTADELYREGKQAMTEKDPGKAAKDFQRLVQRYPRDERADEALLAWARIAQERGDVREALSLAKRLVEGYPESALAYKARIMMGNLSDDEAARGIFSELYQEATRATSSPDSLNKAEEIFQAFLDRFPEDERADDTFFALAQVAQNAGDEMKAIGYYEKLLNRYPKSEHNYKAQFMIGFIYSESLSDYKKAKAAYQKVIDVYPRCDLAKDAQFMIDNMGKSIEELDIFGEKK